MNIKTIAAFAIGSAVLFCGCGKGNVNETGLPMDMSGERTLGIMGADIDVRLNHADDLWEQSVKKRFGARTDDAMSKHIVDFSNAACGKRWAARQMAEDVYTYTFKNYFFLDGVSGFIYNLEYLTQIPHKLLRGICCLDGVGTYFGAVAKLCLGAVAAVVGLVASPVVNTVCHPFETVANLTIGILPLEGMDIITRGKFIMDSWFSYMLRTNIIASLWDIVWGCVFYPLWQAVTFFI